MLPNRHGSSDSYRYGFNGKEKDDEVKGEGNSYDFGARLNDTRVGRWLTLDGKPKSDQSNYVFTRNNPIIFVDPDGQDDWYFDFTTKATYVIRNGKPNRYFITEYIYTEPNEKGFSFGHPQNKPYSINSKAIKEVFTQNIPLWNKARKMYPIGSEQEKEIYNAFKKIDENAVAMVVMSPLLVLGALEALPFLATEATVLAETGVLQTTLTEAFATNTLRVGAMNGGTEFVSQYASNVLINNDFSLGSIDYFDVGLSAVSSKIGSQLGQSFFDFKGGELSISSLENATTNFIFKKSSSKLTSKFNNTIGKPLVDFSPSMGTYLQGAGLTVIKTTTKSINKKVKEDLNSNNEKKLENDN